MAIAGLICGYVGGILSIAVVLVIGLLSARAASTVSNVRLLPAYSSSAVPAVPAVPAPPRPPVVAHCPVVGTLPTSAMDPVTSGAPLPAAPSLGH